MLNETIKAHRTAKGLSQEELALRLNVVRQTVSKWEKGLSVPDAGMLIKLAEALDTTVTALLGEPTLEAEQPETIQALAAKLEQLNEQLARRSERSRKLWRAVFSAAGLLSCSGIVRYALGAVHQHRSHQLLANTPNVIGGASGPTGIFVTSCPLHWAPLLLAMAIGIAAVIGLYRTRRG